MIPPLEAEIGACERREHHTMLALADGMQQGIDVMDRAGRLATADRDGWEAHIIAARQHIRGSVGRV